jgi:hypothetical protein
MADLIISLWCSLSILQLQSQLFLKLVQVLKGHTQKHCFPFSHEIKFINYNSITMTQILETLVLEYITAFYPQI